MIVVDTSIVIPAFVEGPNGALIQRLKAIDSDWCVPELCRHEVLNVLVTIVRHDALSLETAQEVLARARLFLANWTRPVDMASALRLAVDYKVSGYDAQFIALAQQLGTLCITEDGRLRGVFPNVTRSLREFCER